MSVIDVKQFVIGLREQAFLILPRDIEQAQQRKLIIENYVPEILKALEKQEPKKWLLNFDINGDSIYRCENCKEDFVLIDGTPKDNNYNFCPCCGQCLKEPPLIKCIVDSPANKFKISAAYINERALRDLILPKENGEDSEGMNEQ